MAHLNTQTGLWEDDENGPAPAQAGAIGAQAAPVPPSPPSPSIAIGEPTMITPAQAEAPSTTVPEPVPAPVTPYQPQAAPLPNVDRVVSQPERDTLEGINRNEAGQATNAAQKGAGGQAAAQAHLDAAIREDELRLQHEQERARIADDAEKAVAQETARAKAQYGEYLKAANDPGAPKSFWQSVAAAIAIGAGQYAAGMTGGRNTALDIITANETNIERQKKDVENKLLAASKRADADVEGLRKQRDEAFRQLDLKQAANLQKSASKLRTELARVGLSQAQIDSNAEVQKVEADALQKRENVFAAIRGQEVELAKADILASAKKAQALRKGGGGGTGPSGAAEVGRQLAKYATENPGDSEGLYRLAGELKVPDKQVQKVVDDALKNAKATEGQSKDAKQSAIGLRAIDEIEKSGYTPTKGEIQKWLNNQKQVAQAAKAGEGTGIGAMIGGAAAGFAQGHGMLAQSEVEGLSEPAQKYFANVRRFMETIGRAQSGAAISNTEWQNFFNQYGPNSKGGLQAAREYLGEQKQASGVAGRQVAATPKGEGAAGPAAAGPSEREQAQAIKNDPAKWSRLSASQKARLEQYLKGR
jgi:hypothetical protein